MKPRPKHERQLAEARAWALAGELAEALAAVFSIMHCDKDGDYFICGEQEQTLAHARAVLAKAEASEAAVRELARLAGIARA